MYAELNNEQEKQAINCEQLYAALEQARHLAANYAYGMHWKSIADKDYLYRTRQLPRPKGRSLQGSHAE